MPIKIIATPSKPRLSGFTLEDNKSLYGDIVSKYTIAEVAGGTTTDRIDKDARYRSHEGATYTRDASIEAVGDFISLTPSICSVSPYGKVHRESSGIGRVKVVSPILSKTITFDFRNEANEESFVDVFIGTVEGSLASHLEQQVVSRLVNGMSIASNGHAYSVQNHSTKEYVRNSSLWCADVDLSGVSPWNSDGGVRKAGTLITPRHIVNARHYQLPIGATVRFVEHQAPYTAHDRVIVGKVALIYSNDIAVYTLDSDLPDTISPVEYFPHNCKDYLHHVMDNASPLLYFDQEEKVLVARLWSIINGIYLRPYDPYTLRGSFYEKPISGDSGNPWFLIVNGKPVLLTTFLGPSSGGSHYDRLDDINQWLIDADTQAGVSGVDDPTWPNANGHYQVKPADFSAFPNYA